MLHRVDRDVRTWAQEVMGDVSVQLGPPAAGDAPEGISIYLYSLTQRPPERTRRRTSYSLEVRYVVTSRSEEPERAHEWLGDLLYAAMIHPDFEVGYLEGSDRLWSQLGVPPQPAFILRAIARSELPMQRAPLVDRSRIEVGAMHRVHGAVIGPGEKPIGDARVRLSNGRQLAVSDSRGRFHVDLPALADAALKLIVVAGEQQQDVEVVVDGTHAQDNPLIVRFESMED